MASATRTRLIASALDVIVRQHESRWFDPPALQLADTGDLSGQARLEILEVPGIWTGREGEERGAASLWEKGEDPRAENRPMNKSGDPGPGRRFAQGCVNDDWFDGSNLSHEPGSGGCGSGRPRAPLVERPGQPGGRLGDVLLRHWPESSSRPDRLLRRPRPGRAGVRRDPEAIGRDSARESC